MPIYFCIYIYIFLFNILIYVIIYVHIQTYVHSMCVLTAYSQSAEPFQPGSKKWGILSGGILRLFQAHSK